jgi:tetratricopeptide (TPR) repeat protein
MELITNPTLCLNMIVKNEAKIITRLFDTVLPIIDCYCICDTGSTDDTIKVITDYFSSKNITGKVIIEPFKNFCHNRNVALKECVGMSDYVLLMDADMKLEINKFKKTDLLAADHFCILQGSDSFFYQNVRIIRNTGQYQYCGVTHEYINTPSNSKFANIDKSSLFIQDIGDGGSKSDKFERDIRLLKEGLQEEPNNARYYFYLANSCHDSGRFEEAIPYYEKRIELGGWKEEVWYSYYRIGLCYKNMSNMPNAINAWLNGFDFYPERLEGLYEIVKHYRLISKHKLSKMFYDECIKILDKNHDRTAYLFLHNDVYTYKLFYEYTIIAAYVGIKNINNEVIKVINNGTNVQEKDNLLKNMRFYKFKLEPIKVINLDHTIEMDCFNNGEPIKFQSSSSCLYKKREEGNEDKYFINIRYVNYTIDGEGLYHNCDKYIITANRHMVLDSDFNEIESAFFKLPFEDRRYIGVEDVRVFYNEANKKSIFIGTGFHKNNKIGVVYGNYNTDISNNEINPINAIEITQTFKETNCEKNWVYAYYNTQTCVVYDWSPLTICVVAEQTNELSVVEKKQMPKIFENIRGSTCGFKYFYVEEVVQIATGENTSLQMEITNSEQWFVGHIVSYENPRHYYHILMVFDMNMNLLRYSAPFKFEGEPIEYCLGIVVERDRVIMSYSIWDRASRLGIYNKDYIESLLIYHS